MDTKDIMRLIAMAGYLVMIVVIGIWASKRSKTSEEFYLGERGLGPWVSAMSAEASDMSSWLLMGLPGLAYATGLADAGWTAVGLALGTYLNWKIVALRMRTYTEIAGDSITVPDFFSNRFHDRKKILMNVAAIFIFLFFIVYTSSGFVACGKLFESLFGFNYQMSMLISAAAIIIYTIIGGFLAESTVDFIQGMLMIVALLVTIAFGLVTVGGVPAVLESTRDYVGYFNIFSTADPAGGAAVPFGVIKVLSALAWGLGYFGMPHVLLRFMAIRKPQELKKARRIGTTWVVFALCFAVCMGMLGRALYPDLLTGTATENIFIEMCKRLFNTGILPLIGGVMLSGIVAAQTSTSDSQLLIASSAVSQNFFKGWLKPKADDKQVMVVSRVTILIIAVFACILALNPQSSIFNIVSFAWAGFGAVFGPLVLFSLFWKRTTLAGALAGMLSGGIVVFVWNLVLSKLGGIFSLYELLPAFIVSSIMIVVVSLLTRTSDSVEREFDKYQEMTRKYQTEE